MQLVRAMLATAFVAVGLVAAPARGTTTSVITFENYDEGANFAPSFTDPATGLSFHDSTSLNQNFVIEYSDAVGAVPFLPGHYLTGNGYAPGPSGSIAPFGFTATPTAPVAAASIDVFYQLYTAPSVTIVLTGYDAANHPVASDSVLVDTFGLQSKTLSISSPTNTISSIVLSQTDVVFVGVDNVSLTVLPEPSLLAAAPAAAGMLALRRRSPRRRFHEFRPRRNP